MMLITIGLFVLAWSRRSSAASASVASAPTPAGSTTGSTATSARGGRCSADDVALAAQAMTLRDDAPPNG